MTFYVTTREWKPLAMLSSYKAAIDHALSLALRFDEVVKVISFEDGGEWREDVPLTTHLTLSPGPQPKAA